VGLSSSQPEAAIFPNGNNHTTTMNPE